MLALNIFMGYAYIILCFVFVFVFLKKEMFARVLEIDFSDIFSKNASEITS